MIIINELDLYKFIQDARTKTAWCGEEFIICNGSILNKIVMDRNLI